MRDPTERLQDIFEVSEHIEQYAGRGWAAVKENTLVGKRHDRDGGVSN